MSSREGWRHILAVHVRLQVKEMGLVRLLGLQEREGDAAAGDQRCAGGMNQIPANGTDIEGSPQEVGGAVGIDDLFSAEQLWLGTPAA